MIKRSEIIVGSALIISLESTDDFIVKLPLYLLFFDRVIVYSKNGNIPVCPLEMESIKSRSCPLDWSTVSLAFSRRRR